MKKAVAWLPTEEHWEAFLADCGVPLDSHKQPCDTRCQTHEEAVEAMVEVLAATGDDEPWLLLAEPNLVDKLAPNCNLGTQKGRAQAAVKMASTHTLKLGLKITKDAIGSALVSEPKFPNVTRLLETRGKVKIYEVLG